MRTDEVRPVHLFAAFGSRPDTETAQNVADRLIRKGIAHIPQSACDAIISPAPILASHSEHQFGHFSTCSRSTWVVAVLGAIKLLGDEFAIPGQDGFWFRDLGDLAQSFPAESLADFGQGHSL